MPNKQTTQCMIKSDGTFAKSTKATDICPGWDSAFKFGSYPDDGFECRPCDPLKEMWVAVDFDTNKGVSACIPRPLELIFEHYNTVGNLASLISIYFILKYFWRWIFGQVRHK